MAPLVVVALVLTWCLLLICIVSCDLCIKRQSEINCQECNENNENNENIYSHMEQNEYEEIQKECLICMNTIRIQDIERLRCKHFFHRECLSAWMKIKPNCPVCRKKECCVRINN